MWLTRRDCLALALTGFALSASAQEFADGRLGLSGFDPVTYFLPGGPQAGVSGIEVAARDRTWRFASHANRDAFLRDPTVYTPRLGGYDAVGVLEGRLVDADPLIFAVVGDRLYLFHDAQRRAKVLADPGLVARAEAEWPALGRLTDEGRE